MFHVYGQIVPDPHTFNGVAGACVPSRFFSIDKSFMADEQWRIVAVPSTVAPENFIQNIRKTLNNALDDNGSKKHASVKLYSFVDPQSGYWRYQRELVCVRTIPKRAKYDSEQVHY